MLQIDWTSYTCARCEWKPTAAKNRGAQVQVEAHIQSHHGIDVSAPPARVAAEGQTPGMGVIGAFPNPNGRTPSPDRA